MLRTLLVWRNKRCPNAHRIFNKLLQCTIVKIKLGNRERRKPIGFRILTNWQVTKKSSFRKGEEKSNSLAYLTIVVSVVIPLCLRGHHCHQYNKGNRQPWHLKHTILHEFLSLFTMSNQKFLIKPKICGCLFGVYRGEIFTLLNAIMERRQRYWVD